MLKNERSLEAEGRLENLDEFLSVTQTFESQSEDKSLVAFLTDLALVADIDRVDEDTTAGEEVILMTMHSAKGLEFPVVFIVGLEEGYSLILVLLWKRMKCKKNVVLLM